MKFRKDINGLRAIAVVAVVLFHFNPSWLQGGFAGVDVFFVISGFLMTGIIFRGIEQDSFSVLKFYMARANRIIPALALLCFALLVFGWFYLTPLEYKALGKHAASSVIFLSNFTYWKEAGYFAAASHEKWLLHTWSLSVEWQFYIIYPLILVFMRRFMTLKTMRFLVVLATVVGFILCVIASYLSPNASYYLFPTRAWEMMLGGVAYLFPWNLQDSRRKILERFGLVLICGSYFLVSANSPWPGYLALFPVVGSFLIIQAQRDDSFITNNIVFQKLGSWSYSIYLWHWPFVVAIYTFSLSERYIYIGIVMSVFIGFLSYKYIEKIKFNTNFTSGLSFLRSKPIYIAGSIAILGSILFTNSNAVSSYRLSGNQLLAARQQQHDLNDLGCEVADNSKSLGCIHGEGPVKAIIIGDSHAQTQISTLSDRAKSSGGSVLSLVMSACPTIKDVYKMNSVVGRKPDRSCGKMVNDAIDLVSIDYPNVPIIIMNRYSFYIRGFNEADRKRSPTPDRFVDEIFTERSKRYEDNMTGHMLDTICEFSQKNPVYLVRPIPEMKINVPKHLFRSIIWDDEEDRVMITRTEYDQRNNIIIDMQNKAVATCGTKVLDPIPYLCDSEYCYSDIDDKPIYFDDDHLSIFGSKLISPIYNDVF